MSDKPELEGQGKPFIGELYNPHGEADSREVVKTSLEMDATTQPPLAEIEGSHGGIEMEGSRGGAEMYGGNAPVELEAPVRPVELPSPYPGGSAISSPRIRPHERSQSPAAEEVTLQSSSPEAPEPPFPRSLSSLSPSSRLRPDPPPPSSGAETKDLEEPKNPEGRMRRWVSIGKRWRRNEGTN